MYTDFIIYTDRDRKATFNRQLAITEEHFRLFWEDMEKGLDALRQKSWYLDQTERARVKLELYFCVKTLMDAYISVRDEVAGAMPYSAYPYRKDGGRWIGMGMQYPAGHIWEDDAEFRKYSVNGEFGFTERGFRDAKNLEIRGYGTEFGDFTDYSRAPHYVKWFYELWEEGTAEASAVSAHVLQDAGALIERGILRREGTLKLDIPVIAREAYREACSQSAA